jgi:hypothetical protein
MARRSRHQCESRYCPDEKRTLKVIPRGRSSTKLHFETEILFDHFRNEYNQRKNFVEVLLCYQKSKEVPKERKFLGEEQMGGGR